DVQALFHHDAAEERDDHFIVGNPERAAPCHVAAIRVELLAVDAARPDGNVAVHALRTEDECGGLRGRHDDFAATIETAHDMASDRFERLQMVISEIGVKAGVHRGDSGDLVPPRPGDCT